MNMTHLEVNLVQHNGMWMDKDARDHMVALEDTALKISHELTSALSNTLWQLGDQNMPIIDKVKAAASSISALQHNLELFRVANVECRDHIFKLTNAIGKYRAAIEQLTGQPESVELVPEVKAALDVLGWKVDTHRAPGTIRPWTKPKVMTGHIDFE